MASPVLAIFWFDTEDYITPESDEIPLRLAKLFKKRGIKVTFKIVGEKIRALEKRGREDVIRAMGEHDIGYHSNTHSIHPVISEYIDDLDWDEGMSEFEERERGGVEDLERIYGRKLSCYGHPGLCWVPQAYPALRKWGIRVYLDMTYSISSLNDRPFYYCNMLNLMGLGDALFSLDASGGPGKLSEDHLIRVKDRLLESYKKLESSSVPGLISMYAHPTTYATEEFWDIVNYANGKNPPRQGTKKPRVKSAEKVEEHLANLERFVELAQSLPNISFITAQDALKIYEDRSDGREFSPEEIRALCEKSVGSIYFYRVEEAVYLNPAEIFAIVLESLFFYSKHGSFPKRQLCHLHPYGPKKRIETNASAELSFEVSDFLAHCESAYGEIELTSYIPSSFRLSTSTLSPEDMFATCCDLYLALRGEKQKSARIKVVKGKFDVGNYVTEEGSRKDWKLTYTNPEGFEAPRQTELAKLQTWTLKPAIPDPSKILRR
jgi:hypothetical protein